MNNTSLKISKKLLVYIVTALTLIFFSGISVRAAEAPRQPTFETIQKTTIEGKYAERLWDLIDIEQIDVKDKIDLPIGSFAINDDGKIAVAFDNSKIIGVYDDSFDLLKAFRIHVDGLHGVDWHNGDLLLIGVRGDYAVEFTLDGEPVNSYHFTDENEFNEYFYKVVYSGVHFTPDAVYTLKKSAYDGDKLMTRHGLQQLVKTDSDDGNTEILYQHTYKSWEEEINDNALPAAFLLLLAVNTLILIAVRIKRLLSGEYFKEKPGYETPQYNKN